MISDSQKTPEPKAARLEDMVRGWFVGDFQPTALKTQNCEVAIRENKAGDYEEMHYHAVATEITVILEGEVEMCGKRWRAGDIIILEPKTATDFRAITDVRTVVVKTPGAQKDKHLGHP